MKTCPHCGASAGDASTVCELDGSVLVPSSLANTVPAAKASGAFCLSCGARDGDDGSGRCGKCGSSFERVTIPLTIGSRVGEYTIAAFHGEGDLAVQDAAGVRRLLVFGPRDSVVAEAEALRRLPGGPFASVVDEGHALEVGHFALLTFDVGSAIRLDDVDLSFEQAIATVLSILDAAAALEAAGYHWEPAFTDFYLREGGELVVARARGVRRRAAHEPLNAKRAMEALAEVFLPIPLGHGTPDLVRLLMPRLNFSTAAHRTVASTREILERAGDEAARTPASADRGPVASLCDPGLRRNHNEDATAFAAVGSPAAPLSVLVVCDGVSSSSRAGEASTIAAKVACDSIASALAAVDGSPDAERVSAAVLASIRAAHLAICTAGLDHAGGPPPGTTIVAAVVHGTELTVGWVGDSRAYWISRTEAKLCTTDHSWVNDALASGSVTHAEAMASPFAHALTRCLGPLETSVRLFEDVEPDIRTHHLDGTGFVILCSDGLWNYFPLAEQLAVVVRGLGEQVDARDLARSLVSRALAEGGGDNVSVVVQKVVAA